LWSRSRSLKGEILEKEIVVVAAAPVRRRLPDLRNSVTHKFRIGDEENKFYLTVGLYEDGAPGEIFLRGAKQGSFEHGILDGFALLFSIALQHGVPLKALVFKFKHVKFEPSGLTQSTGIRFADSVLDYIARWMEIKFLGGEPNAGEVPTTSTERLDAGSAR
jgi:ribonucleoside-diphosphate reductase alpha chain